MFFSLIFSSSFSVTYFSFFYISISTLLFCCPVVFSLFILFYFYFYFNHFYWFVLFPCFILQLAHCFGFVFRLCVFVSINPNCLISFLSSICLVVLLLFVLSGPVFASFTCVCFLVSVFICLILFLPFLRGFVFFF